MTLSKYQNSMPFPIPKIQIVMLSRVWVIRVRGGVKRSTQQREFISGT